MGVECYEPLHSGLFLQILVIMKEVFLYFFACRFRFLNLETKELSEILTSTLS